MSVQWSGRMRVKGTTVLGEHLKAVGCTERDTTVVDQKSEAPGSQGMQLPCGCLCSLCSVSSALRGRGQGTADAPGDPKLTLAGEKSLAGRELSRC